MLTKVKRLIHVRMGETEEAEIPTLPNGAWVRGCSWNPNS